MSRKELSRKGLKSIPDILEKLDNVENIQGDLKRLADSLDLCARSRKAMNKLTILHWLHALKFYDISHSVSSLVRVGQDVVDEYLSVLRDPEEARDFMESSLFPTIKKFRLLDYLVPLRAQHAVSHMWH